MRAFVDVGVCARAHPYLRVCARACVYLQVEGGRSFVRPSGTEDCVRVYAEV